MSQRYERQIKADLHHSDIIGAIGAYLTENKRDPELIKKISEGICAGLARFNYYAHKIEKRKRHPGRERDDLDWYYKTMSELIRRYNEHVAFPTKKEDAFYLDFERLISHLVGIGGYLRPLEDEQQSGFQLLTDTAEFSTEIEYDIASPLTPNDFTKEIKLQGKTTTLIHELVQEGRITEIHGGKHATYLTRDNGNLYFFNANDPSGERVLIKDLKELGERIVNAHGNAKNYMILIANLKEPQLKSEKDKEDKTPIKIVYPSFNEIFNQLDFVQNKTDVNQIDKIGYTPLHHAVLWQNKTLAQELMSRHANPHAKAPNGWTPLYLAFSRGNLTDFSMLEILGMKKSLITYMHSHFLEVVKLHQLIANLTKTYSLSFIAEPYKRLNQSIVDAIALFMQTNDAEKAFKYLRDQAVEIINLEANKNRGILSLFTKPSELPDIITQALKKSGIKLEQLPDKQTIISLEDRATDCLAAFKKIITETDFSSGADSKELKVISVSATMTKKLVPQVIKDLWFSLNLADSQNPFGNLKELNSIAKDYLAKKEKSDDNTYRFCEFVVRQTDAYTPKVGLKSKKI
ncbi:MAG: ankyrin repeat domain-containing protein [Gammaproteobacteria bacterium]